MTWNPESPCSCDIGMKLKKMGCDDLKSTCPEGKWDESSCTCNFDKQAKKMDDESCSDANKAACKPPMTWNPESPCSCDIGMKLEKMDAYA